MAVHASWNIPLVVLSYVVAVVASYTALDLAGRVVSSYGWTRRLWLAGGAFAMGTGIWSMHFTGMLAFDMGMPVSYDVPITLLSAVIAIAASGLALFVVGRGLMRIPQLLVAGSVMGVGIASMHYTGMGAMRMAATISYDRILVALSVLIAIVASIAALYLSYRLNQGDTPWAGWLKGGSALVMGAAIVGMHYTGMAAATFTPASGEVTPSYNMNTPILGFGIGIFTLLILGLALISAVIDRRFSVRAVELKESERRYESLFDFNPDGVFSLDTEGRFLGANAAAKEITGYQIGELQRKSFAELVLEEDRQKVTGYFEKVDRGESQNYEVAIANKFGKHVDLSVTSIPIIVSGEIVGIYKIAKDVTERKQAEEEVRLLNEDLERRVEERTQELETAITELRESEERYALVLEGSHDGIFDWDVRTGELYWNDRLFEMFGLSRSEFTPTLERFLELVHPEDRQTLLNNITAHLEQGAAFDMEFRYRDFSSEYCVCTSRAKAQRDKDGAPIRMAGIATDITERKRTEEVQRFLAEASTILSSSLDYQATLTEIARSAVPHLGDWCAVDVLEEDGSVNRLAMVHQDPEKVAWAHELQRRYPPDQDAPQGVLQVMRSGQSEFYPEVTDDMLVAAARDAEHLRLMREFGFTSVIIVPLVARGQTLGTITLVTAESRRRYGEADLRLAEELARRGGLAMDNARLFEEAQDEIAERKQAEEEIHKLNETLEQRVEERTAQLQNAVADLEQAKVELQAAKEAAEAANRAKSEFLANMSHEIRTPMNGVIGMTGLLLDTELSEEQREYAETVQSSGENLLTIINDILDFSKIEAGKMHIETIDFDLRTAVEETVELLAEQAYDKGLELVSIIEQEVPSVLRCDPGRLRQVLVNLLGNAIKFTEEGEVVLRVSLAAETDDEAVIRFEVKDTGIGMTQEQQSRLFESFAQADASTTRRFGGTGLGLAISKQLVELMRGEIGVESELGVGSTFCFAVPLKKRPEEARATLPTRANLRGLRVLVVVDNSTNRRILHEQVISWDMKNGQAEDGRTALEMLRAAAETGVPYDLAILDMQMQGMDGVQVAQAVKADPAISHTRLVLLTSLGWRGEEAHRVGIEACLAKPVKQSELYDTLATVMSSTVGEAEPKRRHEARLVTRHSIEEAKARSGARLSHAHVLVAEDNAVNQKVAVRMLERLGYRANVAANGLEALEALSRVPYAAVLMDVQMPEMDGYEATAKIRRHEGPKGRHTPIVAMTANALQGDREKALEAGMDDYVSKPVKPEELEAVLKRWIPEPDIAASASEEETGGAVAPEDTTSSLDRSVLEGLRELQEEGEPDIIDELIELFSSDVPPQLVALREAVEGGNAHLVERIAHTLKGSCGNMGAIRMAKFCEQLQEVGASQDLVKVPGLLDQLEAEFHRVCSMLQAERSRNQY